MEYRNVGSICCIFFVQGECHAWPIQPWKPVRPPSKSVSNYYISICSLLEHAEKKVCKKDMTISVYRRRKAYRYSAAGTICSQIWRVRAWYISVSPYLHLYTGYLQFSIYVKYFLLSRKICFFLWFLFILLVPKFTVVIPKMLGLYTDFFSLTYKYLNIISR